MKIIFPILVLAIWPSLGLGQSDEQVLRSSSPSGLKINEDAMIPAGRDGAVSASGTSSAPAVSGERKGKSGAGSLQASGKGGVQVQGKTNIKAHAQQLNAVATGVDNRSGNEVGAIGKK